MGGERLIQGVPAALSATRPPPSVASNWAYPRRSQGLNVQTDSCPKQIPHFYHLLLSFSPFLLLGLSFSHESFKRDRQQGSKSHSPEGIDELLGYMYILPSSHES